MGFDSEKYKDMLRKIEKQYGEKKKTPDIEVKKEKEVPAKPERKKRETYDEKLEEIKTRPGPKSKTILMRKKKFDEEEEENKKQETKKKSSPIPEPEEGDGVRRGGRVRKPFGSDIYESAKEELEAMLKKKEMGNLSDTFTNLAGTSKEDEDTPEAKSVSRKKTSLGKDFILWENDDKSSSRRSSRSSKQSFTGEESLPGRSSRQSNASAKSKLAKGDEVSTYSTREGSPVKEGSPEPLTSSDTEKKDDEPLRRRRKSP